MQNTTSTTSAPPPMPLPPPPPGQSTHDIRTYLDSNPIQMERMRKIEEYFSHRKDGPIPNENNSFDSSSSPPHIPPDLPTPPTNHNECPLNVCAAHIVCISESIQIVDGPSIVYFLHGPCNHIRKEGGCQFGEGCNWNHTTGKPKRYEMVLPTLSKQPSSISYHQGIDDECIPIIALYDDKDKEKGGENNWAGADSILCDQTYDDTNWDDPEYESSPTVNKIANELIRIEAGRKRVMRNHNVHLPQLKRTAWPVLDDASEEELANENDRISIQFYMQEVSLALIENVPHSEEEVAVQAYHDFIVQYYEDSAKSAGKDFSMSALRQPPRNSAQQATYDELLRVLRDVILAYLIEQNVVLLPGSEAFEHIDPSKFPISNCNAHIYWLLDILKSGQAGKGDDREKRYLLEYIIATLMSIIDIDNIPKEVDVEVMRLLREELARFLPPKLPSTDYEGLLVEMTSLPLSTIHYLWGIVKSVEECPSLGGAIEIQSYPKRLFLNAFESGFQEWCLANGIEIERKSIRHEWVNNNFFGYYLSSRSYDLEALDKLVSVKNFNPGERLTMSTTVIRAEEDSSWKPGRLNENTKKHRQATESILDEIVGTGFWRNSSDKTPLDCLGPDVKPTSKHCFAHWLYTDVDRHGMMFVKRVSLKMLVTFGGVVFFDVDTVATQILNDGKGMDLVDYILSCTFILPNGEEGKFKFVDKHLENTVLKMEYEGDEHVRIAVVHCRTCAMLDTDPKREITWDVLAEVHEPCARSMQYLQDLNGLLSSPNTNLITNKSLHRPLKNISFPWSMYFADGTANCHVSGKAAALGWKNYHETKKNLYVEGENGLRKDSELVSKNARRQLKRRNPTIVSEEKKVEHDSKINRKLACSLSRAPKGDADALQERFQATADLIRAIDPKSASYRKNSFVNSGMFNPSFMSKFEAFYNGGKKNRGNKTANFAPTAQTIDANDPVVARMVYTGEFYFIQTKVAKGAKTAKANINFVPPADGTLITSPKRPCGTYEFDDNGEVKPLHFSAAKFVPNLTLSGMQERCKDRNKGTTKTKKKKALKFLDYKIEMPMIPQGAGQGCSGNQMVTDRSGPRQNLTHQNIVMLRFVWKKDGTEEERLEEFRNHVNAHGSVKFTETEEDDSDDEESD